MGQAKHRHLRPDAVRCLPDRGLLLEKRDGAEPADRGCYQHGDHRIRLLLRIEQRVRAEDGAPERSAANATTSDAISDPDRNGVNLHSHSGCHSSADATPDANPWAVDAMIAAGEERAMLARIIAAERRDEILIEVLRDVLKAEYRILRGQTADRAMQRLDEAADLLHISGEQT